MNFETNNNSENTTGQILREYWLGHAVKHSLRAHHTVYSVSVQKQSAFVLRICTFFSSFFACFFFIFFPSCFSSGNLPADATHTRFAVTHLINQISSFLHIIIYYSHLDFSLLVAYILFAIHTLHVTRWRNGIEAKERLGRRIKREGERENSRNGRKKKTISKRKKTYWKNSVKIYEFRLNSAKTCIATVTNI